MSMDTPQVPTVPRAGGSAGLRVPFGLRGERVYAPSEVEPGKRCWCVCPGCGQPLSAKAQSSQSKRAHFAHMPGPECALGLETGVHLRAKQVIAERMQLLLPGWAGRAPDMPNPPTARDIDGQLHQGQAVELPQRRVELKSVALERPMQGFVPDVLAQDEEGELLVEIRVTHAVDEPKAGRVQAGAWRMVEIDLSGLDRDIVSNPAAFEQAVLGDPGNRHWVVHPESEARWQVAKQELDTEVAALNAELQQERERIERERERNREIAAAKARGLQARREWRRRKVRSELAEELESLKRVADPRWVEEHCRALKAQARARVDQLLHGLDPAVRSACQRSHPNAWIFGVDPALWQLEAYRRFVGRHEPGTELNSSDIGRWLRKSFPIERELYTLFRARYEARKKAREAGCNQFSLSYWVFTDEENELIPCFYEPVNELVRQWASAQLVKSLYYPRGAFVALPPPSHGMRPVAALDPRPEKPLDSLSRTSSL